MTVANKIQANNPIVHAGELGYLLWLRRDLPPVYSTAVKTFPEVAAFESALRRQASGLGQDVDPSLLDLSTVDNTASFSAPEITMDLPPIEPAPITITMPDVPPIAVPTDSSGAAGQAASNVGPSVIASIAAAAAKIIPAALNTGAAVINANTIQRTLGTAQLQYGAYTAGRAPYQTGIVTGPDGVQYLAAVTQPYATSSVAAALSQPVAGFPLWAWGLAAAAGLALLS